MTIKDWIFVLAISGLGMMTANFIGFHVAFTESLPGVLVLLLIALCAAGLAHVIPLKLPTVAYCSILGLLCACPLSPVSQFVIESAGKINFTAPLTMVGAFAGMSISNQLLLLHQYAEGQGFTNCREYYDDNISGTTFRSEGHVVHDADGEIVLGAFGLEAFIDRQDLAGRGVLGAEAVAPTDDLHGDTPLLVDGADILIQGLSHGAGFLGAVQHGDALAGAGDRCQEVLRGKGAVEVDIHQAHLLALGGEVVHGFLGGFGGGAHEDDDPLRVGGAVVVKEVVVPARQLVDLLHVLLHGFGMEAIF